VGMGLNLLQLEIQSSSKRTVQTVKQSMCYAAENLNVLFLGCRTLSFRVVPSNSDAEVVLCL
jgi:hypothetical protein